MHTITFIPGDGTGPEVAQAARRVIEAAGVKLEWEEHQAGQQALEKYGTPLPEDIIESIRRNKVALKGPVTTPVGTGFRSVNVSLRQELDLYACLRPCKYYPGVKSKYPGLDIVVVRESTEDLYSGIEFQEGTEASKEFMEFILERTGKRIREDSGISLKPISRFASRRIVKFAFEYALKYNRKKVTAVHKANILKYSDGLFLESAKEVAKEYENAGIEFEDRIVDNMAMQLVQKPELYDVLVLPNLYGDIISDLCAGLVGGLGVAPSANIGDIAAIFEPVHGSAPKYAGLNKVNPTAMILSGVLMLRHIGESEAADKIEKAVSQVIAEGEKVTYDLKPSPEDPSAVGTKEMTEAIIEKMTTS